MSRIDKQKKREEREHRFKLLFCAQFYREEEIPEQLSRYFETLADGEREALSEEEEAFSLKAASNAAGEQQNPPVEEAGRSSLKAASDIAGVPAGGEESSSSKELSGEGEAKESGDAPLLKTEEDGGDPDPVGESGLRLSEEREIQKEVRGMVGRIEELDRRINEAAEGWTTKRMSRTDLTVLRLALYEILFRDEIPDKVSINEAVDIAKKYGGAESGSFVNGVLARLLNPKRSAVTKSAPREKKPELQSAERGGRRVQVLVHRK